MYFKGLNPEYRIHSTTKKEEVAEGIFFFAPASACSCSKNTESSTGKGCCYVCSLVPFLSFMPARASGFILIIPEKAGFIDDLLQM
ncbi:hypothetical protein NC99_27920 [Sunxiuqinia dokdonensis]|uniref:Uncharacterized protein n=1 Tax=Sunxiuqinia dokdonensis TaxID=1409788 RepID=A0A0L8V785_9BACT|nr:hypothetical protein NC99_27920 [Sunxiuqinia dokdonensis]